MILWTLAVSATVADLYLRHKSYYDALRESQLAAPG